MDIWAGVKKTLSTIAPVLANAIVPGSGGVAASLVSTVLGCENTPTAIEQALVNITPEQQLALVVEQNRHKEKLVEIAASLDQAYLADRANARTREIEITKITGKRDINLYILAWVVVAGFFILCVVLMRTALPEGASKEVVCLLFGALATGFGTVLNYFFGSSKSSADKTEILAGPKM